MMANRRMAVPGSGIDPRTVARSRSGVSSGARPRTRTGAMTTRGPAEPGLSTSTTQPSTTVGSAIAGAMGAATASVRSFDTARPRAKQAKSIRGRVHSLAAPRHREISQTPAATAAIRRSGHSGGSTFRPK